MITGIAETMAITMMVTARSLAIASRLCPLLIRAIQFGYRAVAHPGAVLTLRETEKQKEATPVSSIVQIMRDKLRVHWISPTHTRY